MTDGVPGVGDVIDKYEIEGVLGRGGMGAVLRARHVLTGRTVALKWMLPDAHSDAASVQRFLREARAMGRIEHPNVVGVIDVGVLDRAAYLVMEMLRGASLRGYLERESKVAPGRAIALLMPALSGVAAAHRAGVVHRDLKPENLFVVEDDRGHPVTTKVLDFGISKLREEGVHPPQPSITQTGTTMGTPSYMSPEQVRGARDVDARTDVWALGAILYEMVTGRVPFRAETYGALMVAIVLEPLVPPDVVSPELDRGLARVIERALAKDAGERFQSVDELREALAPFAGELSGARPAMVSHDPSTKAPTTPAGLRAAPVLLAPTPSDGIASPAGASERASKVPTRQSRRTPEDRAEVASSSGPAPAIELESGAMRPQRPVVAASMVETPSAPVLPTIPTGRRLILGLAIACTIPIVAVLVHAITRGSSDEPAPTGELTPPAPPAEPDSVAAVPDSVAAVPDSVAAVPDSVVPADSIAPAAADSDPPPASQSDSVPPSLDSHAPAPRSHAHRRAERGTTPAATSTEPQPASSGTTGRTGRISRDEF